MDPHPDWEGTGESHSQHAEPVMAMPSKDARTWAMVCHLASFAWVTPIPAANIIAPLAIWLWKREDDAFIDDQGKESVNFQITVFLIFIVGFVLVFLFFLGLLILIPLAILNFVCVIIAMIKSNSGEAYRYPLNFRFIK